MKIEVRCCCDPGRLLGHVTLPDERVRRGPIVFPLLGPAPRAPFDREPAPAPCEHVTLEIDTVHVMLRSWLAVKAHETPIATLRRIPTFEEAK